MKYNLIIKKEMFYNISSYLSILLLILYPFIAFFEKYFFNFMPFFLLVIINILIILLLKKIKLIFKGNKLSIIVLLFFFTKAMFPFINSEIDMRDNIFIYLNQNILPIFLYLSLISSKNEVIYKFLFNRIFKLSLFLMFIAIAIISIYFNLPRLGGELVLRIADLYAIYLGIDFCKNKFELVRLGFGLIILIFLSSVSSIICFLFASILTYMYIYRNNIEKLIYMFLFLLIITFTLILSFSFASRDSIPGQLINRLDDIRAGDDPSLIGRRYWYYMGLENILKKPILGEYLYHYKIYGYKYSSYGGYMHNVLSIWAEFGIFSFFLFFVILIYSLGKIKILKAEAIFCLFYMILIGIFRSHEWFFYPLCFFILVSNLNIKESKYV